MKKRFIAYFLLTLSLTVSSQLVLKKIHATSNVKPITYMSSQQDKQIVQESLLLAQQQTILGDIKKEETTKEESTTRILAANTASTKQEVKSTPSLSRGGTGLSQPQANTSVKPAVKKQQSTNTNSKPVEKNQSTYSSNVELIDWWKSGRTIFSIGTVAEIKDLYTGKTFMAKRTMGTNHADTEALTQKDTDIIKSIWGGFSWARRPVILTINGKKYAASMSAMPHAGLDSAPAYAVVDNRSEGYGSGQNLDVIKGNGMDGHFDIHFLNSTRHKDGQKDPEHQAAVLKAAGK